jgi:hypothetical protein
MQFNLNLKYEQNTFIGASFQESKSFNTSIKTTQVSITLAINK